MVMMAMPRPDLAAHRESLRLPIAEIVKRVVAILGRKLTAYVGNVKDVRVVDGWMAGGTLHGDAEMRLRFTFQVARTLREQDTPALVQAWMTGVNPELGDRVPLRLMREGNLQTVAPEILRAARAFLAGG